MADTTRIVWGEENTKAYVLVVHPDISFKSGAVSELGPRGRAASPELVTGAVLGWLLSEVYLWVIPCTRKSVLILYVQHTPVRRLLRNNFK